MESFARGRTRVRGRWPLGRGSGARGGVDAAFSRCYRVTHNIDDVCKNFGNSRHTAVPRIDGDAEGSVI